ncbi:MAG: pyridoxamine 5'-phosphate oxidase family protein [Dokdonella sp.]
MAKPTRHKVQRVRKRADYDRTAIYRILDAAWLAHVSFASDGQPFVIPMLYVRDGDDLLLHGSIASRLLKQLGAGVEACVCVTIVDALVLTRSHFHHSANYRSVVAFGTATPVVDPAEKAAGLAGFVDAMLPGRAAEARPANRKELAATNLLRFRMVDASAKVREGGPADDAADLSLPHWAGLLPLRQGYDQPIPAADLSPDISIPDSLLALS